MKLKTLLLTCLVPGIFSMLPSTRASIAVGQNVTIGGFFSQGYLYSSANNYPTTDQGGTWDFREMAFNASTTIGAHVRVGAQAFAQRLGTLGEDKVLLDWAVLDYNVNPAFGLRVGRVKYPKGLYGEALDLDVVRPFIFLPNAVYNPALRDFSASFDGAMIYGTFNVGRSGFDYKVFYGDIPMSPSKGVAEFYNNSGLYAASSGVQSLNMDSVRGAQLAWTPPVSGLKLVYSYSEYAGLATDGSFAAYPVNMHTSFHRFRWNTVSAEYTLRDWVFAAEWQRCGGELKYAAAPILPLVVDNSGWDGWYVSASRRLSSRFEVGAYHGRLSERFSSRPMSDPLSHQYDTAVSFRYDVSEHVLFKLEAHAIDGRFQTFNTARIPNPAPENRTELIAAKLTFSF